MTEETTNRPRPPGQTTGGPQRPSQQASAPMLTFDLRAEQDQLKREDAWARGDHNAKTLVKESDFRIVLIALKKGGRIEQHHRAGRLSIQVVSGKLKIILETARSSCQPGICSRWSATSPTVSRRSKRACFC